MVVDSSHMLLDVRLARARASLGPSLNLRFGRNLVLRSAGQEFRVPDDRLTRCLES